MVGVGVAKRTIRGVGLAYSSHVARPFWHVWHMRSVGCVEAVLWRVFWVSALQGQRGGISASPSLRARVAEGAFFRSTRVCGVVVSLHRQQRLGKGRLLRICVYLFVYQCDKAK